MSKKKNTGIILAVLAVLIVIGALIGVYFIRQSANNGEYVSLGDYKVTEGHYNYFITKGYDEAYALTGVSDSSLLDQTIDGMKAEKWIKEYAVNASKKYLLVNKLFDDLGLELTDADKQAVNDRFDEEWYNSGRVAVYGPMGVVEEIYGDILTTDQKQARLVEYYAEDLKAEVTEDQIAERFQTDYAAAEYIAMNYVNGDNESMLDRFEGYKSELENGKDFETLLDELNDSGDEFVITSIDLETAKRDVVFTRTGSIFPRNFVKELFAAEIGDIIYYDDSPNMIYVIAKRVDIMADEVNLKAYREEVIDALISEQYAQRLESEASSYEFSVNKSTTGGIDIRRLYGME